ncbi:hypothetical protein P3X46_011067 [Hevea brasiliensis]|uniref:DUF4005 domain-containing protein n=1 Tax=Hevea brasiliensis TaxID=3981 RepID=A0ABQ9MKA9_HEVBR|nr:hypothetical protein P3X46_011067 [Hevea brasiliensis]
MGKAARWLKGFLGMKKDKEKERDNVGDTSSSISSEKREKKRWSFGNSGRDNSLIPQIPENLQVKDVAWLRCYLAETEREQNKHAIMVAAATAAAVDAVAAVAQAAVAAVRLTSNGRGTLFGGGRERWAAIKVQTVFRGFLARKALRALKGLVKIQALVRGYLVRKRFAATLHSMHALMRAQTSVRSQRARRSVKKENIFQPKNRPRKSIAISSPLSCSIPARITIPNYKNRQDFDWYLTGEECRFSTAHITPRFSNSIRSNAPATPAKIVCGDSYFRPYSNFPNYMANTQSFRAKLRSHSAPKQRPEPGQKKRLSLNEIMVARNSISSVRMQRSCYQVDEGLDF